MTPTEMAAYRRARWRQWREDNLEACREKKRVYMAKRRAEKPQEIYESKKRWADANKEHLRRKSRARARLRRGLKRTTEQKLIARAHAVIPRTLPRDVRDDVFGMLILGVYEGRFSTRLQPADAKAIIVEHYRQFSKFTTLSLDSVIGDDGFTRGQAMGVY